MTTAWTPAHLALLATQQPRQAPVITSADCRVIVPGHWLWDFWPAQDEAGAVVGIDGGELWFALAAPHSADPLDRHATARIRLLHRTDAGWRDLGDAMPGSWSPGSREWSGSAVVRGDRLTLWFTAAGRRGEAALSYEQRLFETQGTIAAGPVLSGWSPPVELVASDGVRYDRARETSGVVGTIKAFRDPAWFRDPADGAAYLLFTGSAATNLPHNGVVGIARAQPGGWRLLPPLVSAVGVNNELERPHVVIRAGRYHLFWSTQARVFAPGITAPTGLYGMTAERLAGPWTPIGGSGLVLANPVAAPAQAYSWLVGAHGRISSFIDVAPDGSFGGMFAPELDWPAAADR